MTGNKPSEERSGFLGRIFIQPCSFLVEILKYIPVLQGSIVIFGRYSSWTSTDKESPYYCQTRPMMFAFVLLLIKWLLAPTIMLLTCLRQSGGLSLVQISPDTFLLLVKF